MESIEISYCEANSYVTIGENFSQKIQIRNLRSIPIGADSKLWLNATSCFAKSNVSVGEVPAGGSVDVYLEHRWLANACIDTLCPSCSYVLTDGASTVAQFTSENRVNRFIGGLKKYRPTAGARAESTNILFFGPAGAGKSSFMTSMISLLSPGDDVQQGVCPIGATSEHGTTTLRRYPVPELHVNLWDTWGLTPNTYTGGELAAIVEGSIPNGWEMGTAFSERPGEINRARATATTRRMHAVLVFLPCASLRDDTEMASLRVLLNDVKKSGLSPIFLLARADEQVKPENQANFRNNPNATGHAELEALKKLAVSKINVQMARIHYAVPYCAELKKTFEIDRLLFKILELALKSADSYMAFQLQTDDEKRDLDEGKQPAGPPSVSGPPPYPAAKPPVSDMDQLQNLTQMFKDGLLTKKQFEKAKNKMFPGAC